MSNTSLNKPIAQSVVFKTYQKLVLGKSFNYESKPRSVFILRCYLSRPDDIIKSLVYKVVPAIYQSETQKTKKFNKVHNVQENPEKPDETKPRKQHYFSPDEPIR